ncbi:MAG: DNA (cytosine-5-)-methyltransferase, partial [Clostridia bacterium]|nr:DNA (cytosine-5-)-methyltransferase [Clostridia bacterium]
PQADIWTAGSPCQNVSIAGGRAGLHGDRSGLFFQFVDLLKGKAEADKPQWIILENVKGLLSSNAGWDFLEYLGELAEAGYDCEWQIFNSKDYGVPQNRERVYTIGRLRSRGGREILPISAESCGNLKQVIGGMQGYRVYDPSGVSSTLASEAGGMGAKTGLYLIDQQTGERTMLPDYDFEPGAGVGTDSAFGGGRTHKYSVGKVYMLSVDRVTSRLISIDGKGDRQVYTKKDGGIQCFDIFGKSVLFIGMRDGRLPELYSLDLATGEEKRLTSFNEEWYQQHKPQTPEHFLFRNRDGLELDGFVLYPAGFEPGKKYPAVLQIHGGPKGVYGTTYFHEMQVLASHGMFVIFTNPRGGDGRGSAFADLTRKLGTIDYEDLLDFTDAALARIPEIDGARVGICGGSYGGFMVNWMIGHTDRYAAACSQRSIANYMSKCLTTDIGFTHNLAQMGTNPWDGFDVMWGTSPLRYAHNAKTPTLFIHSDNDYRCWMSEGLQMFTALKMQGVKTRLALYHGESHGLSRTGSPRNRLARLDEIVSWFEQNL